jgi:transposase
VRARRRSIVDAVEDEIRRELQLVYQPPDPYQRTEYQPGEIAQWDIWFPPVAISVEGGEPQKFPVWVGVLGYSRVSAARMMPSRETHDVLEEHWLCLEQLGGVLHLSVYDNEGAIVRRRRPQITLNDASQRFRGVLGMGVYVLRPAHPEGKGSVERMNGYFQTLFLPGRDFVSVEDFNQQLVKWFETHAHVRFHRTIRARPCDRLAEDRAAMLPLPPT